MKKDFIIRFAAVSSIAALFFDVVLIFFLGFLTPNYNPVTQYISELGSSFSPYAPIINLWWQIYSIPMIIFAYGLYLGIKKSKLNWLAPLAIFAESVFNGVLAGYFSCDLGCTGNSFSNTMHIWFSGIGVIISVFIPLCLIISTRKDKNWLSLMGFLVFIQTVLFFAAAIFFYQEYLFMFFGKAYDSGLYQRIYMIVYYIALIVPAAHLYKIKNKS